jgi:glycine/D-amino acid oxidase-like deaminating enzyme
MDWLLARAPHPLGRVDVLVVGGGCAGVNAAVAAGRRGAHVLLVEREGTLGGISSGVLDTFYGFWTPGDAPQRIVDGIPGEIVRHLVANDAAFERPNTYGAGIGVTYNPEVLRVLYDRLCDDAGVEVLLHTVLVDVEMDARKVGSVLLVSGTSLMSVEAATVVDASGEAVGVALAGGECEEWPDIASPQSLTATFTMSPVGTSIDEVSRAQLRAAMELAAATSRFDLPRRDGSIHRTTVDGARFVHMTRVSDHNPLDPAALSLAERDGRRQVLEYAGFLREYVPGFEHAQIAWMCRRIGVRESRRVRGRYWLTHNDVVAGSKFPDGVVQAGAPIEDHGAGSDTRWEFLDEGRVYEIPFRSLLPADVEDMVVAGRCLSASHDAHASARNMAQCMAMGQASGTAAAMAADVGVVVANLDPVNLRSELVKDGVLLKGEAK